MMRPTLHFARPLQQLPRCLATPIHLWLVFVTQETLVPKNVAIQTIQLTHSAVGASLDNLLHAL